MDLFFVAEQNCRERWKNIRCAFVRSQKEPPTGSKSKAKKKYYLAEHLSFLIPYTKGKSGSGNLSSSAGCSRNTIISENDESVEEYLHTDETTDPTATHNQQNDNDNTTTINEDDDLATPIIEKELVPSKIRKTMAEKTYESKISADKAFVQWVKEKQSKPRNDDPDSLFLLSLVPDVKKLGDKQKRRFKIKVLSLLEELVEDTQDKTPSLTNSTSTTPHSVASGPQYSSDCSSSSTALYPVTSFDQYSSDCNSSTNTVQAEVQYNLPDQQLWHHL